MHLIFPIAVFEAQQLMTSLVWSRMKYVLTTDNTPFFSFIFKFDLKTQSNWRCTVRFTENSEEWLTFHNACCQATRSRRVLWRRVDRPETGRRSTRRRFPETLSPCRTSPRTASGNSEWSPWMTLDRENPARAQDRIQSAIPSVSALCSYSVRICSS